MQVMMLAVACTGMQEWSGTDLGVTLLQAAAKCGGFPLYDLFTPADADGSLIAQPPIKANVQLKSFTAQIATVATHTGMPKAALMLQ